MKKKTTKLWRESRLRSRLPGWRRKSRIWRTGTPLETVQVMTWAGHMRAPPRQEWVQSSKIGLSTKNGVDPPHWSPSLSWASAFRMLQEQTRRLMWVLNEEGRSSRGSSICELKQFVRSTSNFVHCAPDTFLFLVWISETKKLRWKFQWSDVQTPQNWLRHSGWAVVKITNRSPWATLSLG